MPVNGNLITIQIQMQRRLKSREVFYIDEDVIKGLVLEYFRQLELLESADADRAYIAGIMTESH